jgi:3alpha(or 20beta)-hydroxysteroid dehydrogenase
LIMEQLAGRTILISGGARGQGAAIGRRFAAEGARVVLGDIRDGDGKLLAAELGDQARYVHLDVREEEDWAAAVRHATDEFGTLDGLVNNAGVFRACPLETDSAAAFQDVIEVNQLGVFLGMRAVIGALRCAGGGTIVNTASVDGLNGAAMATAYCASKFAVVGMTKVAATELGRDKIRVNAICPGVIETDMVSEFRDGIQRVLDQRVPLRRAGLPSEVAALALFLTSGESSYCTGGCFVADGGWTAEI